MDESAQQAIELPVVAAGRWWWLNLSGGSTPTLAAVADAFASRGVVITDRDGGVLIDGQSVGRHRPWVQAGVRPGVQMGVPSSERSRQADAPPVIEVTVVAGAGAGVVRRLPAGRWVLGGAAGLVMQVTAGDVPPHACALDVVGEITQPEGVRVAITPLSVGRVEVHGRPVVTMTPWRQGALLTVGDIALRWTVSTSVPVPQESSDAAWPVTLRRRGRSSPERTDMAVAPADPHNRAGPPLIPGVLAAATSLIMAAVVRQPWLAFMGLSSLAANGAWWAIDRHRHHRRRMAAVTDVEGRCAQLAVQMRRHRPSLTHVMDMAAGRTPGLWERRPQRHDDVWEVGVGEGRQRHGPCWLDDVPVVVDLGPGARVGLAGPGAVALARAMIGHLVTQVGPADVCLQVRCDPHDRRFADLEVLPHWRTAAAHRVVVVVDPDANRSPPVDVDATAAWLVIDERPHGDTVGAWCTTVMRWDGTLRTVDVMHDGDVVAQVVPAGVTVEWLHDLVCCLVRWRDPESGPGAVGIEPPPASVPWAGLHGGVCDVPTVLTTWNQTGRGLPARVGRGPSAAVELDLTRHGPHALIAGTTGSGKSELLRTLVTSWAWFSPPHRLHLILIDFKGGAAFDACARLPHVAGLVTDLDGDTIGRMLAGLRAELTRRETLLRSRGVSDLSQWPHDHGAPTALARLVIVVDEVAALVQDHPQVMGALVALAQRGRSLGLHLVLATQRPAGVVRDDVRANTDLRICLRVADRTDALDVVGDVRPAAFDRRRPGRALLRSGADEPIEVQVADMSGPWTRSLPDVWVRPVGEATPPPPAGDPWPPGPGTLPTVVATLAAAAQQIGLATPPPLWQPPLPARLELPPELADDPTVVGLLDDVPGCRRLPLRYDPAGHVVVIGAPGSGVSHVLQRIVVARGGDSIDLHTQATCTQAMDRVLDELDRRTASPGAAPPLTVLVDGVGAMRRRWEQELGSASWRAAGQWDRLLSDGPRLGVVVVAGADRVASCGTTLLAVAATRWLLRPLDPLDAAHLGVRWPMASTDSVPPGRLVDAVTGLVGQVAFSTPSTMCTVRSA